MWTEECFVKPLSNCGKPNMTTSSILVNMIEHGLKLWSINFYTEIWNIQKIYKKMFCRGSNGYNYSENRSAYGGLGMLNDIKV